MNAVVNDMVPDDDMKARLQQALEFHEKDEKTRKELSNLPGMISLKKMLDH